MTTNRQRGASMLEMILVGIPVIFTLICVFEISRGMWIYHTLAYTSKEAVRFAIVHGVSCTPNPPFTTNDCRVTVADVAQKIVHNGVGLVCDDGTYGCVNVAFSPPVGCSTLEGCLTDSSVWPPPGSNSIGVPVRIDISVPFYSALAMFWPGAGSPGKGSSVHFARVNLGASSTERIQF